MTDKNLNGLSIRYIPDEGIKEKYFRCDNRLNRKRFFMRHCVLWLTSLLIGAIIGFCCAAFNLPAKSCNIISLILTLPLSISAIMLNIRRMHDMNKSGWWLLLVFVPFINLLFVLYMFFAKGTQGSNRFGANPINGII